MCVRGTGDRHGLCGKAADFSGGVEIGDIPKYEVNLNFIYRYADLPIGVKNRFVGHPDPGW